MASAIDSAWLEARIARTKELIVAYEDALIALSSGAIQTYTLDTGQTRQVVTKQQIGSLRITLETLENRLATYDARLNGGSFIGRPGF